MVSFDQKDYSQPTHYPGLGNQEVNQEYKCDGCGKTFLSYKALAGHKARVHNVTVPYINPWNAFCVVTLFSNADSARRHETNQSYHCWHEGPIR